MMRDLLLARHGGVDRKSVLEDWSEVSASREGIETREVARSADPAKSMAGGSFSDYRHAVDGARKAGAGLAQLVEQPPCKR
jgi:hypothetical protein